MVPLLISTLLLLIFPAQAWTTGSLVSSFGGSVLITGRPEQQVTGPSFITMKKGKANVPPQMRSNYKKQQEMAAMREQVLAASKPGADGLPVFNLFVRTKSGAKVSLFIQRFRFTTDALSIVDVVSLWKFQRRPAIGSIGQELRWWRVTGWSEQETD